MLTSIIAGIVTFAFTTVLTVAGVGAAFILIPVFLFLGIDLHVSMATALLLNAIAMTFASVHFIKARLVKFRIGFPILIAATALSPLGAYTSKFLPVPFLKWLFVAFLVFAASMMLFYKSRRESGINSRVSMKKDAIYGMAVGIVAGYLGGLLGVGGGNFIVPVLIWLGIDSKEASATTAFTVIFSSFSGFLGHASLGAFNFQLLFWTAVGSIIGALLGAHLMHKKLSSAQVKKTIGWILYFIAAYMIWNLLKS